VSDTTASLRRKLTSAGDLQSVVRTMRPLAASSIVQYKQSVRASADDARTLEVGSSVCFRGTGTMHAPTGETRRMDALVFGSDQGLLGQFNDAVADHAVSNSRRGMPGWHAGGGCAGSWASSMKSNN
jgi:F-type H+-transporting ATPase subunit gamma